MLPAGDTPTKTDHEVISNSATFHSLREDALFDTLCGGPGAPEVTHGFGNALGGFTVGRLVQHALHLNAELGHIHQLSPSAPVTGTTTSPAPNDASRRALLSRSLIVGMITAGVPAFKAVITELCPP